MLERKAPIKKMEIPNILTLLFQHSKHSTSHLFTNQFRLQRFDLFLNICDLKIVALETKEIISPLVKQVEKHY